MKLKGIPSEAAGKELMETLMNRFSNNMERHRGITWESVAARISRSENALETLYMMETTGGEPDVTGYDPQGDTIIFTDCSAESPAGRRSLCYDSEALDSRKENKPAGSALDMAKDIGIEILNENEYRRLQELGTFDAKTSSWIVTPGEVRALGGALFCDYRYGKVFVYHNGAQSYYASRGFRGMLRI